MQGAESAVAMVSKPVLEVCVAISSQLARGVLDLLHNDVPRHSPRKVQPRPQSLAQKWRSPAPRQGRRHEHSRCSEQSRCSERLRFPEFRFLPAEDESASAECPSILALSLTSTGPKKPNSSRRLNALRSWISALPGPQAWGIYVPRRSLSLATRGDELLLGDSMLQGGRWLGRRCSDGRGYRWQAMRTSRGMGNLSLRELGVVEDLSELYTWSELEAVVVPQRIPAQLEPANQVVPSTAIPAQSQAPAVKSGPRMSAAEIQGMLMEVAKSSAEDDDITDDTPLMEAAMSSLSAVQFRNEISTQVGFALPATLLLDYPSLSTIGSYIQELMAEEAGQDEEVAVPTAEMRVPEAASQTPIGTQQRREQEASAMTSTATTSYPAYPNTKGYVLFRGGTAGGDAIIVPAPSRLSLGPALLSAAALGGSDGLRQSWTLQQYPGGSTISLEFQGSTLGGYKIDLFPNQHCQVRLSTPPLFHLPRPS